MHHEATEAQIDRVVATIEEMGYEARPMVGAQRTAVGLVGNEGRVDSARLTALEGVRDVIHVSQPYRQASREWQPDDTLIAVPNGPTVGRDVIFMAGPCAVESADQILEVAHAVRDAGASVLRGGAFKPRTSPYSFQGLGARALDYLVQARDATGLAVVTEVVDPAHVDEVADAADIVQVGARNMQNYPLLTRLGGIAKPVLLKRGMAATLTELLLAAEYILTAGNPHVMLCERGVRGFDPGTRNLLDLSAVPLLKERTHLPVIVDPSHGTGHRAYVTPMALAAVAAGAQGVMVEVHPDPPRALSDGAQSLYLEQFRELVQRARQVAIAVGSQVVEPVALEVPS